MSKVRLFVLLLTLSTIACAKKNRESDARTCTLRPDIQQVVYPDGVTRKSDIYDCSYESGVKCVLTDYARDRSLSFMVCP